jgi:PAS domain S-box-containing protein
MRSPPPSAPTAGLRPSAAHHVIHPAFAALIALALLVSVYLLLPAGIADEALYPLYVIAVAVGAGWRGARTALVVAAGGAVLLGLAWQRSLQWPDALVLLLQFGGVLAVSLLTLRMRQVMRDLHAERLRYRSVLRSASDALLVIDAEGRLEFFNHQAACLLGVRSSAIGLPLHESLPLQLADGTAFDGLVAPVDAMHPLPEDLEAKRGDGRWIAVGGSIAPVGSAEAEGSGHVVCLRDVAALRESHRQLVRSEARLRSLFDSDLLAICTIDRSGDIRSSNATFLGLLGYSSSEFAGEPLHLQGLTPKEHWPLVAAVLDQLSRGGSCPPYRTELLRRDGGRTRVTVGATQLKDDELALFAVDTGSHDAAEQRVAESRRLLQSVVDAIPAFVAYVDAAGYYRLGNRYQPHLLSPGEGALHLPAQDALPPALFEQLGGHLRRALEGTATRMLLSLRDESHAARHYQVQLEPRHDDTGAVAGVVLHAFEISEQLLRQRALLDSEVRFRRLAEASAAIVCHVDDRGMVLHLSGWRRFTGSGSGTRRLDQIMACVHPQDLHRLRRLLVTARRHRGTLEGEFQLRHSSGEYRHVAVRAVPLPAAPGTPVQWVGSARDVHGRRVAQQQLQQAEGELRLILDTMPAQIAYVESDRRFRWANRAFLDMHRITGEVRGMRAFDVLSLGDQAALGDAIQRGLEGEPNQVEWRIDHPGLGVLWSLATVTPDRNADGHVAGCILLCTDNTERKLADQALRRSNREHRALAESVPHMVWIAHGDGRMVYFNQRWRDYTGLSPGTPWQEALVEEDREAAVEAFHHAVASGDELSIEVRMQRACDAAVRWHVMRAVPVIDEGVRAARWYGTCTDIEDQKQAQGTLQRAQRRTQQFLATLSHELRNPLAALMTSAHLLNRNDLPDESRAPLARTMSRQTVQLQRLVEDLLDISRITQGKVQLRLECVDLNLIAANVCADFSARAASRGVRLECHAPAEPAQLMGDPARLRQIADNLVSNALKATPGGGHIAIAVLSDRPGFHLLRVSDGGAGIPDALFGRMFEPFVQGEEWPERGLGLGLSIVARMVELHGGTIEAVNLPGGGARFEVALPALADAAPDEARAPMQVAREEGLPGRVLVVDDERDNADALRMLLELHGYDVETANEGETALDRLQAMRPDAVICDLGMPGEWNGFRLAARMRRESGKSLLLIAFSGHGSRDDIVRATEAGFDHHLIKPGSPAELLHTLGHGLRSKRVSGAEATMRPA